MDAHGFRAVRIRVGEAMGRGADAAPGRTARLVPRMREALGAAVDISTDGVLPAPAAPGWGITPDPAFERAAECRTAALP